jgi:hypothetical protein
MNFTALKPGRFWRQLKQAPERGIPNRNMEIAMLQTGKEKDELINDFKKLKLRK